MTLHFTRIPSEPTRTPSYGTWFCDRDGLWALDLFDARGFVTRLGFESAAECIAEAWNLWPDAEIAINRVVEGVEVSAYWERDGKAVLW